MEKCENLLECASYYIDILGYILNGKNKFCEFLNHLNYLNYHLDLQNRKLNLVLLNGITSNHLHLIASYSGIKHVSSLVSLGIGCTVSDFRCLQFLKHKRHIRKGYSNVTVTVIYTSSLSLMCARTVGFMSTRMYCKKLKTEGVRIAILSCELLESISQNPYCCTLNKR